MERILPIVVVAAAIALASYFLYRRLEKIPKVVVKEKYTNLSKFLIYNYFDNHVVDILVLQKNGPSEYLAKDILPKSTAGLSADRVEKYLAEGNTLQIYVKSVNGITTSEPTKLDSKQSLDAASIKHFADYVINTDEDERIKALHIGMITTRFIGSTDGLRMSTTSNNAVGGNATLKIHNVTNMLLRLNDGDITIAPHSTFRYLGYLNQGVTLGTIFTDDDKLYADYQYLKPYSDLYYGVVSDLRQPLDGCWQLTYDDNCEFGQSLWPFEMGIM